MNFWNIPIFIVAASLTVFIWWQVPKLQLRHLQPRIQDPKDRAELEDNFRKTITQVFGGATVIGGLYFGYMQLNQQKQDSNALLISSQLEKGFDQLGEAGSDEIIRHIGGIYMLEDIMNTSSEYHGPIVAALSAFIRSQTSQLSPGSLQSYSPPQLDVEAALSVLGNRASGNGYINLHGAIIPWCNLDGQNFQDAYLSWTNFDHAWMEGTNFESATMTHGSFINAKLQGANLRGVDMTGANLSGADLRDISPRQETIVSQSQLDQACGNANTHLPARYHKLAPCSVK